MAHKVVSKAVAKSKSASNGKHFVGLFPTPAWPVLRRFSDPLTSGLLQIVATGPLGVVTISHFSQIAMAASLTRSMKLARSLSYRVTISLKILIIQKKRSTTLRSM